MFSNVKAVVSAAYISLKGCGADDMSLAFVLESAVANRVTSWPRLTNSSVK